MNSLEWITVTLLIALLSGKELIRAYGADGLKKYMRVLNILIVPSFVAFCVIVIKTVVSAVAG